MGAAGEGLEGVEAGGVAFLAARGEGERLRAALAPSLEEACARGETVKKSVVRAVYRLRYGEGIAYLKRAFTRNAYERWKEALVGSKCGREWEALRYFAASGILAPTPIAVAERRAAGLLGRFGPVLESALLTRDLAPEGTFLDRLARGRPAERRAAIDALGAAVRRLHGAGVFHRDLHASNVLVRRGAAGGVEPALLDLHKAWIWPAVPVFGLARLLDLGKLCHSLSGVASRGEPYRLCRAYLTGSRPPERGAVRDLFRRVRRVAAAIEGERLRSRSRRCVLESTRFAVERAGARTFFRRRAYARAAVEAAIAAHEAGEGTALRDAGRVRATRVPIEGPDGPAAAVVKEYREGGLRGLAAALTGCHRARRAWRAAEALKVRGVDVAEAIALVEERRGPVLARAFLVTRFLEGATDLWTRLKRGAEKGAAARAEEREVASALGAALGRMHRLGIDHRDPKPPNWLVARGSGGAVRVVPVDLEDASVRGRVPWRRRVRALAALHAYAGRKEVPRPRRSLLWLTLQAYCREDAALRGRERELARDVARAAAARLERWGEGAR